MIKSYTPAETDKTSVPQLFVASSVVEWFGPFAGVEIRWHVFERSRQAPFPYDYDAVITGHRPPKKGCLSSAEEAVKEYFTRGEVEALCGYLKKHHSLDVAVKPVKLPLPNDNLLSFRELGNKHMAYGSFDLWEEPGYTLPFQVNGYYDLREHYRG